MAIVDERLKVVVPSGKTIKLISVHRPLERGNYLLSDLVMIRH